MRPQASSSRNRNGDYMIYGYLVPESFLLHHGTAVLARLHELRALAKHDAALAAFLDTECAPLHDLFRLADSPAGRGPTHAETIGLGAYHIMQRAGLLDPTEASPLPGPATGPNMHRYTDTDTDPEADICLDTDLHGPLTAPAPPPGPRALTLRRRRAYFRLHTALGKLVLARLPARDDDLGVREVDYAIALASNDPADGLPLPPCPAPNPDFGFDVDVDVDFGSGFDFDLRFGFGDLDYRRDDAEHPVCALVVERLRAVLGAACRPNWYHAFKKSKLSSGVPVRAGEEAAAKACPVVFCGGLRA